MAETITCDDTSSIDLPDFYDACDQISIGKEEDLRSFAPLLKRLSNNREFVCDYLCDYISMSANIEDSHSFLPPVFMPRVTESYIFRIVIWPTKQPLRKSNQLLYGYPHNHDVGFITCGYLGSGYTTEIYNFDYEKYQGLIGEKVELNFQERATLPLGKIMRYVPGSDVHIQYAPETPSISLNIIRREKLKRYVEYSFDMTTSTIAGHSIKTAVYEALFRSVCLVGGKKSLNVLKKIAEDHPFMRVRATALEVLFEACPSQRDTIISKGMKDTHAYVRAISNSLVSP